MDVLNPPLMRIAQRLYRKNPSRAIPQNIPVGYLEEGHYTMHPTADDVDYEMNCPNESELKTVYLLDAIHVDEFGLFHTTLYVPSIFHGSIIGAKGKVKNTLEEDFACKLDIPAKFKCSSHQIKVSARSEADILAVVNRIECIVCESRPKFRPSHFVSLPCTAPDVVEAFMKFKTEVLAKAEEDKTGAYYNIDGDSFVTETKLHFSLAMLLLVDQREVELASKLLFDFLRREMAEEKPFRLTVRGFDCMNDDPKSVNVLFAKLQEDEETERLQSVANRLSCVFARHGLTIGINREDVPVKLHLTMMKTSKRKDLYSRLQANVQGETPKDPHPIAKYFSGVGIFQDFGDFCLIDGGLFDEIQLCSMGSPDETGPTKFYHCVTKINWGGKNT